MYTSIYTFVQTTKSSQPSSRFKCFKTQFVSKFSLEGTLSYISNWKSCFVLNRFNFLTRSSVIRLVLQNTSIVKMLSLKCFINDLLGRKFRSFFMTAIPLLFLVRTLSICHLKFNFLSRMTFKCFFD